MIKCRKHIGHLKPTQKTGNINPVQNVGILEKIIGGYIQLILEQGDVDSTNGIGWFSLSVLVALNG